jgi:hypothetical protein
MARTEFRFSVNPEQLETDRLQVVNRDNNPENYIPVPLTDELRVKYTLKTPPTGLTLDDIPEIYATLVELLLNQPIMYTFYSNDYSTKNAGLRVVECNKSLAYIIGIITKWLRYELNIDGNIHSSAAHPIGNAPVDSVHMSVLTTKSRIADKNTKSITELTHEQIVKAVRIVLDTFIKSAWFTLDTQIPHVYHQDAHIDDGSVRLVMHTPHRTSMDSADFILHVLGLHIETNTLHTLDKYDMSKRKRVARTDDNKHCYTLMISDNTYFPFKNNPYRDYQFIQSDTYVYIHGDYMQEAMRIFGFNIINPKKRDYDVMSLPHRTEHQKAALCE